TPIVGNQVTSTECAITSILTPAAPEFDLDYNLPSDDVIIGFTIGEAAEHRVTVDNFGSDAIANFSLTMHFSLDANITGSDPLICTQNGLSIQAAQSVEYTFDCVTPRSEEHTSELQ